MTVLNAITSDGCICMFRISLEYKPLLTYAVLTPDCDGAMRFALPFTRNEILNRARGLNVPLLDRVGVIALFCACGIDIETAFLICRHSTEDIVAALELREERQEMSLIEILGPKAA